MSRATFARPGVIVRLALALAAITLPAACGGNKTPVGEVSGKVTFEGKPVGHGMVSFLNSQAGTGDEGVINGDGTYAIKMPLPVGEYKVTIFPLIERRQADPKGPEVGVEKATREIPQKYRVIGSTDLTATVKEGKNEINFDMKR